MSFLDFFFPKKTVPPFEVTKSEFSMAELFAINQYNIQELEKGRSALAYIEKEKKSPEDKNAYPGAPLPSWGNQPVSLYAKIPKNIDKGLEHSFLFLFGNPIALDNKTRHRTINPKADGLLGKGGAGKVKLCQDSHGQHYAVKIQRNVDTSSIERIWAILKKLKYLVVGLNVHGKAYTISKLFEGSNLKNKILDANNNLHKLSTDQISELGLKMAWGLDYLHQQNIVHGDVKINNYMISTPQTGERLTLIDFDSACDMTQPLPTDFPYKVTTQGVTAPEVISFNQYSTASDIYSLGVCYQILNACNTNVVIDKYLIEEMINLNPKKRPSLQFIIQWIQEQRDEKIAKHIFFTTSCIIGGAFGLLTTGLFTLPNLLLLTFAALTYPAILYTKDWFKKNAFHRLLSHKDQPYDIVPDQLEALKHKLESYQVFQESYDLCRTGTLFEKAKSWLYLKNYSSAYYAGCRWFELHPQDERFTPTSHYKL